jgi:hypothetical protein
LNIAAGGPPSKETLRLDLKVLRTNRTPPEAKLLGVGGAIPLLAGVVVVFSVRDPFGIPVARMLVAYAAVILAFLGGIHWGFASAAMARSAVELNAPRILGLSVLPPLASCIGVMLPPPFAALFLASAFTLVLLLDRASERLGYTPFWWMKLRIRLTVAVVFLLLLLATAEFIR